ncbi:MAG: carboxypeptidase-like regulatory domain-containing protein [Bacteroidales bacterium]|nr:carboxypeptidase-like regulatory domain-containing protein [Bacteroidales bacterium]
MIFKQRQIGFFTRFIFQIGSSAYRHIGTLILLIALFPVSLCLSQEKAIIMGRVINQDKKPVEMVNIALEGESSGTSTNNRGEYSLTVPAGKYITVYYSYLGYDIKKEKFYLKVNEKRIHNVTLTAKVEILNEVKIQDQESRKSELIRIDPKTVTVIPSVGGGVESILKTLPGVSSNNELSSQYSVRGGNFDENLVYVNDIEIYRPFLIKAGQQEGLSFINSDLVSSILFSAGGFEAKYGDKMSSVLDIKYKEPKTFAGSVSASLLGASAHLEGFKKKANLSYLVGIRQKSNQYILKSMETKGDYKPSFTDIQTYINYTPNSKLDIGFLGNFSRNKFTVVPETRETRFGTIQEALRLKVYFDGKEIDSYNSGLAALNFNFKTNNKTKLKFIFSAFRSFEYETYDILAEYWLDQLETGFGKESFGEAAYNRGVGGFLNHSRNYLNSTVLAIEHKAYKDIGSAGIIQWGVKYSKEIIDDKINEWSLIDSADYTTPRPADFIDYKIDNYGNIVYNNKIYNSRPFNNFQLKDYVKSHINLNSDRISAFVQQTTSFNVKQEWKLVYGLRASYWSLNNRLDYGPRAMLSFKPQWTKDIVFRYSAGYYYQPPFYRELRNMDGEIVKNIKSQSSLLVSGAMDMNIKAWNRPFRVLSEIYYKYLYNLIPYEIDNVRIRYYPGMLATGYATGFDFKINGEFVKDVESWLSLSIMKTMEDIKNDNKAYIPRPTDQRFNLGLFFQDYIPKNPTYKMHLNFLYGSRLPFEPAKSYKAFTPLRIPPYFRVDIGFSKQIKSEDNPLSDKNLFRFFKNIWLSLEVFNLLQNNNIISYIWVTDVSNQQYAVPNYLTPRQLNLKLFMDF